MIKISTKFPPKAEVLKDPHAFFCDNCQAKYPAIITPPLRKMGNITASAVTHSGLPWAMLAVCNGGRPTALAKLNPVASKPPMTAIAIPAPIDFLPGSDCDSPASLRGSLILFASDSRASVGEDSSQHEEQAEDDRGKHLGRGEAVDNEGAAASRQESRYR